MAKALGKDSLNTLTGLKVGGEEYSYYNLPSAARQLGMNLASLPRSLCVLMENMLRHEDGQTVTVDDVKAFAEWLKTRTSNREIAYSPARVLMQDFTGVPAVVDLAAMRDAMTALGGDASKINPLSPVDLVIDHSVQVDRYGSPHAFEENVRLEIERNRERYEFLRWGQNAFENFRVVPPGTGICHQVNLEYLSKVVWSDTVEGKRIAYPDTLVGTDSHTTMVNGLSVLGWGVGGIEAEAAMLGQPVTMVIPEVIGFKLTGSLKEGVTATDLVLCIVEMLRTRGVVGKFVEFFGPALEHLSLADRATIANMAPEYGATCGFFPIDKETIRYLELSGRDEDTIALVESYAKVQGIWHDERSADPEFTDVLELDISTVEPALAGPKRPQDRILLSEAAASFQKELTGLSGREVNPADRVAVQGEDYTLGHGDVVIAAITSCTNTSNPGVMLAAGLVARKARELGLEVKPWVKTSLAPGSQVVTDYLEAAGLMEDLQAMEFDLVGYGCTTCIGNSGPLLEPIEQAIKDHDLTVTSVLSGNRNFEGRVHALTKANYLASPPLVVAYALAGNMLLDITRDSIGKASNGRDVFLKDIWPSNEELQAVVAKSVTRQMFRSRYADVFKGDKAWQQINAGSGLTYGWDNRSTYVKNPPYFEGMKAQPGDIADIQSARMLAMLGDSTTTDHISPAGGIATESPAAEYLKSHHVAPTDFNSYGSRRGNHEVMMRGTFANIRIRNELAPGTEGGLTTHIPSGEVMSIYDAAMKYKQEATPLIVVAGKEYGTGSSRDWAAKGTRLLGVKAVICESFERIHRSNLIGMGVLPLVFQNNVTRKSLMLDGSEIFDITGIADGLSPRMNVDCTILRKDGSRETVNLLCRLDTEDEVEYFKNGGILHYVLRNISQSADSKAA